MKNIQDEQKQEQGPHQPGQCVYCGNNPVPHFINWYNESLNILLTPFRQFLLYNPLSQKIKKWFSRGKISFKILSAAEKFGIVKRQDDVTKCKVRRAQVLWEEAKKRGINFYELLLFGRGFDTYLAEKTGKEKIIFSGLPRPDDYNGSVLDVMDDKWLLKKILMEHGLPVPFGGSAWRFGEAAAIFEKIQKNGSGGQPACVIVKPRTGSRGRHSTTFIKNLKGLKQAFKIAKKLNFWAVVEEQLDGPVYRATVINNELVGVLRGDPPQVSGDGVLNIEQLVNKKNSQPHEGVANILIDQKMEIFLEKQGLTAKSVPKEGGLVNLSEKIGVSYGGSSSEDFDICHPENKSLFVRAARAVGDPIVGFDFIIPDITKPYSQQHCGFIEANSLPFINLHHDPLKGAPRNAAAKIWDMLGW